MTDNAALNDQRRSLLAICFEFLPRWTPTANRSTQLLKRLALNWDVRVIAPEGSQSLDGVQLIKVAVPPSGQAKRALAQFRLQKLNDWLPWIDDEWEGWREAGFVRAVADVRQRRPDVILVFMYPYASGDIGLRLQRETGVPVVYNFDDTPTCDDMHPHYPSRWHWKCALNWEDRIVRAASAVIYVSQRNLEKVCSRQPVTLRSKLHLVRYGVTEGDIANPTSRGSAGSEHIWTILYSGNMSGWMEFYNPRRQHSFGKRLFAAWNNLGRDVRVSLDQKGSSPYYLAKAVSQMESANPQFANKFRFKLIGNNYPRNVIERALQNGEMSAFVEVEDTIPYRESLREIAVADVLFLCLPSRLDGSEGGRISAKTYEYLATDRPILAALPRGENWDFLEGKPGVWYVAPDDVAGMSRALAEIASGLASGRFAFNRATLQSQFGYDLRALELGAVLHSVVATN